MDLSINSKILPLTKPQFLEDDGEIDGKLKGILSNVFEVAKPPPDTRFDTGNPHFRSLYIFHVLIPEGLINLIAKKYNWSRDKAEDFFVDIESRVTDKDLENFEQELLHDSIKEKEKKLKDRFGSASSDEESSTGNDANNDLPDVEFDSGNEITLQRESNNLSGANVFSDGDIVEELGRNISKFSIEDIKSVKENLKASGLPRKQNLRVNTTSKESKSNRSMRSFLCAICNNQYSHTNTLKRHMERVHPADSIQMYGNGSHSR